MFKSFAFWMVVLCFFAVCVALLGPTFVSLIALDVSPEGIGIFLDLVQ